MTSLPPNPPKPPLWQSALICLAAVAFFTWMRLSVFQDRIFPVSIVLPLLLCLWNRSKVLLHGMAIVLTGVTAVKILGEQPGGVIPPGEKGFWMISELVNIWVVTFAIHCFLGVRSRLDRKRRLLETLNLELEQGNEALAAREEEISRQNEELQSQTEELEQQSEELRQQAEELEQQGADLQELNRELLRREKGLETLLHSGRWMRGDMSESYVMSGVCQAALQILDDVAAAEVIATRPDAYEVWGDCGFGLHGRMEDGISFAQSFACLAAESERTAGLNDIRQRSDLRLPSLRAGRPLVSAIASPVWYEGRVVAVLCAYAVEPREWTEHDFSISEWLASQGALALQSIRIQKELETRRREAEEAAHQKSQFLAAVSHDVRTPANAISLLAELVERASADPQQAHRVPELARNLWTNARSLVDLVSEVLDLTRLDSEPSHLHVTDFSLNELIEAEVFQAQAAAHEKGLTLTKALPHATVTLATDRTKLKRVIANLLANAVKFTEDGSVHVECVLAGEGDARISISDTGVGIPGEAQQKVFDEFFQLRNPERNREKGAGLGLAICRRLVSSLGCSLSLHSEVGCGTTFTIVIPAKLVVKPVIADGHEVRPAPGDERGLEGLRILLVEDNDAARTAMDELLSGGGAAVTTAADGRSAFVCLDGGEFDVLLLDLNLPDTDGTAILQRLAGPGLPAIRRKIVISGDARPERVSQVKALGAHEVLAKPASLARIRAAILADGGGHGAQNGLSTTI